MPALRCSRVAGKLAMRHRLRAHCTRRFEFHFRVGRVHTRRCCCQSTARVAWSGFVERAYSLLSRVLLLRVAWFVHANRRAVRALACSAGCRCASSSVAIALPAFLQRCCCLYRSLRHAAQCVTWRRVCHVAQLARLHASHSPARSGLRPACRPGLLCRTKQKYQTVA